ncbi:MAG: hypothetical protein ACOH5I_25055 [Oligoflexus sp.]
MIPKKILIAIVSLPMLTAVARVQASDKPDKIIVEESHEGGDDLKDDQPIKVPGGTFCGGRQRQSPDSSSTLLNILRKIYCPGVAVEGGQQGHEQ